MVQTAEQNKNSKPQVTPENTLLSLGVSVGNGWTKAAASVKNTAIRSLVSECSEEFFQGNSDTLRVEYGGITYRIGQQDEALADRVADAKKKQLYPLLALTAIAQIVGAGTHHVAVRIAVLNKAMGEALNLTGEHRITVNGRLSVIHIARCACSPEGLGAVASYRRDYGLDAPSKVYALDLGHGTTIALKVVDGKLSSHQATPYGVRDLHQAIAAAVVRAHALEYSPTETDIDLSIRDGSFLLPTVEGDVDFTSIYTEQLGIWWKQIKDKVLAGSASERRGCQLLLMGGGSQLPQLDTLTDVPSIKAPDVAEAKGLAFAGL